jgi:hypothetical protein
MEVIKEISVINDFVECKMGQPVQKYGKVGVYVGMESVITGSVSCGCATLKQMPVIIYPKNDGCIEREEVWFLDPPKRKIHGLSMSTQINDEDPRFEAYKILLSNLR